MSNGFSLGLDERNGPDQISDRTFMFVLGLYVFGGLLASIAAATATYHANLELWVVLVTGIALPIAGIVISVVSQDWKISSFGYALVVVPLGVIIGPAVAYYHLPVVFEAMLITLIVTGGMWVLGVIIPPITQNWGAFIVGALLLLIAGDVARAILPSFGVEPVTLTVWPWIGAILFSGLIVYDINKAMQMPKTLDNAVDASVGVYLDIVNLFLRILEIMGNSSSDNDNN